MRQLLPLLLFLLLPIFVRAGESPTAQQILAQKLKYLTPHETLTLTSRQIEEVETLGTLTLEPEQWRHLRDVGVHCPKRFSNVTPVTASDPGDGIDPDTGEWAVALTRTTVAILHRDSAYEEEAVSGLKKTMEKVATDRDKKWSWLELHVDRRGQFYLGGWLVPFQTLLDTLRASKLASKSDDGDGPTILVYLPYGMKRTSDVVKTRLDTLGKVAKQMGWTACGWPWDDTDPTRGEPFDESR